MKIYILDNGYLLMDKNILLKDAVLASADERNKSCELVHCPIMMILIKHEKGNILFDLGCHPDAGKKGYWPDRVWKMERYFHDPQQELEAQLALCGVMPKDIDTVVLSHLHEDHTGNARLFSHAALYAPKKEYLNAMWSVHTNPDTGYVKEEVTAPYREVHLIEDDFELLPGIEIVNLPGHTNGLLGMALHAEKDGVLIFPQDAVFCEESYGPPARLPGGFEDSVACLASIEKVRSLQKKYDAKVFFGHDPENFPKYRHAPEYYE